MTSQEVLTHPGKLWLKCQSETKSLQKQAVFLISFLQISRLTLTTICSYCRGNARFTKVIHKFCINKYSNLSSSMPGQISTIQCSIITHFLLTNVFKNTYIPYM